MSTKIQIVIYAEEKTLCSEKPANLNPGDVIIASTAAEQSELKNHYQEHINIWVVPNETERKYLPRLKSYLRHAAFRYSRFAKGFDLRVVGPSSKAIEDACEWALGDLKFETVTTTPLHYSIFEKQTHRDALIGTSPAIEALRTRIEALVDESCPVLITGPTGSGKEIVARKLHGKRSGRFTVLNGAMLSEQTAEGKLFGYKEGAFTGAKHDKTGRIEEATEGTFFLDELFHVPDTVRPKLLRAFADAHRGVIHITRMGGHRSEPIEARLLCATQQNHRGGRSGRPIEDEIYYRVAGEVLEIPPLSQRQDDIEQLVTHFVNDRAQVDRDVYDVLKKHSWPGNVRELELVVERALRRNPEQFTAESARFALESERVITANQEGSA
ncbi:MAG: sigma-54-dependent transcriptional regulator [Nannocystaceae bacterium]